LGFTRLFVVEVLIKNQQFVFVDILKLELTIYGFRLLRGKSLSGNSEALFF